MKLTNHYKLPQAIVDFLSRKYYKPGESDFSVTQLLQPPQILQLTQRHDDEITEDVMDQIWSVFGTAVHELFDKYENSGAETELRLYHTYGGVRVGGQVDHYSNRTISDYKVTSVWSVIYDSRKDEWTKQQNIYANIFRKNGYEVDKLQICAILRDWQESKAQQDSSYPQTPVVMIDLDVWSDDLIERFVEERIKIHLDAFTVKDEDLPECTAEDMWQKETKYAVMKKGNKKATRVFDNPSEAVDFCTPEFSDRPSDQYTIETRPGERTRCERYCPVSKFCHQYQQYLASMER